MPAKKCALYSFGHWLPSGQSKTRSASDALLQSIDWRSLLTRSVWTSVFSCASFRSSARLAVSIAGRDWREVQPHRDRTAVIDMRYDPLYMSEDAGAADIIAGGRLQLGISRR